MSVKFEKDIFISYAHIDDEALIEGEKGWITEFHRSLEVRLAQLLGYKPKIWRDLRLQGNDDFSEEIIKELNEIALLISVHSPRYVKSDWCVREVVEFYNVAEGNIGAKIGSKSRIFKVIKTPIDLKLQPPILQGLLGYEFFKIDPFTGKPLEFSKIFGKEAQLAFWSKLDDLAHDIVSLLETIGANDTSDNNQNGDADSEIKRNNGSEDLGTIFLAETSIDLKENRESVRRKLLAKGYRVLPDKNLPLDVESYNNEIREMISESILSIHFIGTGFGFVPEGTAMSNIQLQHAMANSLKIPDSKGKLIWMPPKLEITDERQIRFVEELKNSEIMLDGADLLVSSLEDLEFAIEDKLKIKEVRKDEEVESIEGVGPKQIYLICDQSDIEDVQELDDWLFNKGFDVVLPAFEGNQTEIRLDHQENLINCDAILIYYGKANELWLRSKIRDLLKMAGYGRKKKILSKAVCIANPMNTKKERFRSHEMQVIKLTDDISKSIEPFVKEIV